MPMSLFKIFAITLYELIFAITLCEFKDLLSLFHSQQ